MTTLSGNFGGTLDYADVIGQSANITGLLPVEGIGYFISVHLSRIHEPECPQQRLVSMLLSQKLVHESHIHIIVAKQRTSGDVRATLVVWREDVVLVLIILSIFKAQQIKNL